MKNKLIINIDDERNRPVLLEKPEDYSSPDDDKEAERMMKQDMETICEGLVSLMSTCDRIQFSSKENSIRYVAKHLLAKFPNNKYKEELKGITGEDDGSIKERKKRLQKRITRNTPKRSRTLKRIS